VANTRMDEFERLRNQLEAEGNDLLGEMVRSFAQGLMSAEADVVCGAPWGQQSPDRVNRRNGVPDPKMGHPGGIDRVADT